MSNIKQSPFLGLTGMGGGGTGLALGGALAKRVYMDNVFSTYLYKGSSTARSINNGIDLSGEGGMTWIKQRNGTADHVLNDTVRGAGNRLRTNVTAANASSTSYLSAFNNNGFSLGTDADVNSSSSNYASFSFRKSKSFFDVVTYSGTSNVTTLAHNLKASPGLVIIKRTDSGGAWYVWHRYDSGKYFKLNTTDSASTNSGNQFFGTTFNSTHFSVGHDSNVNGTGGSYVAYLFAGGASSAATARSVDFNGSSDILTINPSSDFDISTNWTAEGWYKCDSINSTDFIFGNFDGGSDWCFLIESSELRFYYNASSYKSLGTAPLGQWNHIAVSKAGSDTRVFLNGIQIGPAWDIGSRSTGTKFTVAGYQNNVGSVVRPFNGKVSNIRVVKGTTLYTSSFIPTYKPLTNITNTKLLICNNSSTTGSTVTPGTITAIGSPSAITDSPFDDPDGYKFGEDGKQQIIKNGSHNNPTTNPIRIYTGWEPQWIMIKNATQSSNWAMFDVMRGIFVGSDGPSLAADVATQENGVVGQGEIVVPHADGFTLRYGLTAVNPGNGDTIIYTAIRRSDGYTAPTPEAGTEIFTMDTGSGSSTIPNYDSTFPVDFAIARNPGANDDWGVGTRLTGPKRLKTNEKEEQGSQGDYTFDSNVGWNKNSSEGSNFQSWMWKRGLGMDLVAFDGNSVQGRDIAHSLGVAPNMMILKNRTRSAGGGADWIVYVSGITHLSVFGSDPDNYGNNPVALELNTTEQAQFSASGYWDHTHPTSTHFRVGDTYSTNQSGQDMIAYLFANIAKISSVGAYTGTGSDVNVTTGFNPRFIILKRVNGGGSWWVFDTLRGIGAGTLADPYLRLDLNNNEIGGTHYISTSATGFTVAGAGNNDTNYNGGKYVYYAHA